MKSIYVYNYFLQIYLFRVLFIFFIFEVIQTVADFPKMATKVESISHALLTI